MALAHEFLGIEAAAGFDIPRSCYNTLNDILRKAKKRFNPNDYLFSNYPDMLLKAIGDFLSKEGFTIENSTNELLSHLLQARKMNCNGSILYYSIGEELGLPLSLVLAPGHLFVRWNYTDKFEYFDWETTKNRKMWDDYYISERNMPMEPIRNHVYLTDLTRNEAQALAWHAVGLVKKWKGDYRGAILAYNQALELKPNFVEAYNDRGNARISDNNDLDGAIDDHEKAISLNPNCVEAYIGLGVAVYFKGDVEKAINLFEKAIFLNSNCGIAYENLAEAKIRKGGY